MKKIRKPDYYAAIIKEDIAKDKDRDSDIAKFRNMLACNWSSGAALKGLPWWQDVVNSAPADSTDAATRTFSTIMPSLRVFPNNPQEVAKHRAEDIEDVLMWHYNKANQRGVKRPLEQKLESVVKVGGVAFQVRYLPFDLKGRTDARSRAMLRQGAFAYRLHDFETVHARYSPEGLESVSLAKVMTLADLKRLFTEENEGVAKLIEQASPDKKREQADLEKTLVNYYEFTDYEVVVRLASICENILDVSVSDPVDIIREEHKLPFLPWVYREASKPMLKTLVDSKSWERQNEMESIQRSIALSVAAHPGWWSITPSGEGVEIDMTEPDGQVQLRTGETVGALQERRADPELMRATQSGEQKLSQQLNTRALQYATEIASSAPYATFNAIMQTTVASLSLMTQVVEAALEDMFYQQLYWINFFKQPLEGQRLRNRKSANPEDMMRKKGAFVRIGPRMNETDMTVEFDPDFLSIQVKLNPNTPTDRQSRQTQAVWYHDRLGMAWEDALEAAGLTDIERDEQNWAVEQLTQATIRREAEKIIAEGQLEIQAAQIQMETQAQQAAQEQTQQQSPENEQMALNQGGAFEMAQGQSPNMGQQPAAMVAPQMTREAITGRAQNEEGL